MKDKVEQIARIKRLIWLYFWLWIFEGALRKWVLPFLADFILLIRDPVALYIYCIALRHGLFPRNLFLTFTGIIAWLSLSAGLVVLSTSPIVALYGFRANYLHLPLIFIIANIFDLKDVRHVGYWVLVISIPMALLMTIQFRSPPNAWINSGEADAFGQITLAEGKIRAPGTFSFILGPVFFYSLTAAFLLEGMLTGRHYPKWLMLASAVSVGLAGAVSGSRGLVAGIFVVLLFAILTGFVLKPQLAFKTFQLVGTIAFVGVLLMQVDVFREGTAVFSKRIEGASNAEGGGQGFVMRALGGLAITPESFYDTPLLGQGLGMGTNVGARLMTGTRHTFLLSEGEVGRVMQESGPVLGIYTLLLRFLIALYILWASARYAFHNSPLAFLLSGASFLVLINGQWGVATPLGYAVLTSGLCLAATREEHVSEVIAVESNRNQIA